MTQPRTCGRARLFALLDFVDHACVLHGVEASLDGSVLKHTLKDVQALTQALCSSDVDHLFECLTLHAAGEGFVSIGVPRTVRCQGVEEEGQPSARLLIDADVNVSCGNAPSVNLDKHGCLLGLERKVPLRYHGGMRYVKAIQTAHE
jgi:hypothetical protein